MQNDGSGFVKRRWRQMKRWLGLGFPPLFTIAILLYLGDLVFTIVVIHVAGIWIENRLLALLATLLFIGFFGMLLEKTSVVPRLRKRFSENPFVLRVLSIFPRENGRDMKESRFIGKEVWWYLSPTVRIRGEITAEGVDREEKRWLVVHFGSPPIRKTGTTLFEFREDDPAIQFTGGSSTDYTLHIATYGNSSHRF